MKSLHSHTGHHAEPHTEAKHTRGFRGYTIDEIRYQRVVNQLRIQVTQQRLIKEITDRSVPKARAMATGLLTFDNVMRFTDIALVFMALTGRIRRFFGIFHRKKK